MEVQTVQEGVSLTGVPKHVPYEPLGTKTALNVLLSIQPQTIYFKEYCSLCGYRILLFIQFYGNRDGIDEQVEYRRILLSQFDKLFFLLLGDIGIDFERDANLLIANRNIIEIYPGIL